MNVFSISRWLVAQTLLTALILTHVCRGDEIRDLQTAAMQQGKASWGHWGTNPEKYSAWTNHSNRLIPVYTFGISLDGVKDDASVYRDANQLRELYGRVPEGTLNPDADYFDQTDIYRLQQAAVEAGKKYVILVVFDGLDWETTRAAAIYKSKRVAYESGRGSGLHFQDYRGANTDFGYMVTAPHNDGTKVDVDAQTVLNPDGMTRGGFDAKLAGSTPWSITTDPEYLIGRNRERLHPYTDSSSSAMSMTAGVKTYNGAINVDPEGKQVVPIARWLQETRGWSIGVVTNVPISHATPACAYANNVHRNDYQDISRDLLGIPSVSHRTQSLGGVDVLLGGGWGEQSNAASRQGANFVPGNTYLTDADLAASDIQNGGKYEIALRTPGRSGREVLRQAAERAATNDHRLLGFFGVPPGNIPFQTADGQFDPTIDAKKLEQYSEADVHENPTLADMTRAALAVLEKNENGFWMMLEPGDVDWANHANNIDNAIGAVLSGDEAFRELTRWIEAKRAWQETAVIVTADHGHLLVLTHPERLIGEKPAANSRAPQQ